MSETYKIACTCDNCERDGEAEFTKGTPVPALFVCPHCGCQTAKKKKATVQLGRNWFDWPHIKPLGLREYVIESPCYNPNEVQVWCKADAGAESTGARDNQ